MPESVSVWILEHRVSGFWQASYDEHTFFHTRKEARDRRKQLGVKGLNYIVTEYKRVESGKP